MFSKQWIKSQRQIAGIRESAKVLSLTLKTIRASVIAGVTTSRLNEIAMQCIQDHSARPSFLGYNGFPAAICTSVDDAVIHGIPNNKPLRNGQIIGIDCGVELRGYYSDAAITLPVGTITQDATNLLRLTEESLHKGINNIRRKSTINDISTAIFNHLHRHNLGIIRNYCGHGVGLAIHEPPSVPNHPSWQNKISLHAGMVLAIEPMATLGDDDVIVLPDGWTVSTKDRSIGAHFEHTILVLENGAEILTDW